MEPIQSSLLTFEAMIAAMARIDNLWNIFLVVNLTFIAGSVYLGPKYKAWELGFFVFLYGIFLWINANGLRDSYLFLEHMFVASEKWLREAAEKDLTLLPLVGYVTDRSWGADGTFWHSRVKQILITHSAGAIAALIVCWRLYDRKSPAEQGSGGKSNSNAAD